MFRFITIFVYIFFFFRRSLISVFKHLGEPVHFSQAFLGIFVALSLLKPLIPVATDPRVLVSVGVAVLL